MKKLFTFTAIIFALTISGCKYKEPCSDYSNTNYNNQPKVTNNSSGFNSEHYVWENWQFSTNRVDKK